jgi:hypothetical protein
MGTLALQALYSSSVAEQHALRQVRRVDGISLPQEITSFETPENCWDRAAACINSRDPDGREAYAVLKGLQCLAGKIR